MKFRILKKGRKFFQAQAESGRSVKLEVDEMTKRYQPGETIDIYVTKIEYGRYKASPPISEEERQAKLEARVLREKLQGALEDARRGLTETRYILAVLRASKRPEYLAKIEPLRKLVEANREKAARPWIGIHGNHIIKTLSEDPESRLFAFGW